MNKKVLFLYNGYASIHEGVSGGEKHTIALIHYLNKNIFNISICGPKNCHSFKLTTEVKLLSYPSIPFEKYIYNFLPILFIVYIYRIICSIFIILRQNPDIIITNSHLFHDTFPMFFTKNRLIKKFVYLHHIISEQKRSGISSIITSFLERTSFSIIRNSNCIVFTDSTVNMEALIDKYNFNSNNVHVIRNGLDMHLINSVKASQKPFFDICYCGRLNRTKGIFDLVELVRIIKKNIPNIVCVIIGNGREKDNLVKLIKKNNLEKNFVFKGFVEEAEKIQIIKSSRIFVLPSHEEGWGIVIGEAMACGLPVIVYKLPDIVKIWGDNVTWIECFNTIEFANKIVELLTNEKLQKLFTDKGLQFSSKLDWKHVLINEINLIEQSV